jgi:class 3 adenylate cyclase
MTSEASRVAQVEEAYEARAYARARALADRALAAGAADPLVRSTLCHFRALALARLGPRGAEVWLAVDADLATARQELFDLREVHVVPWLRLHNSIGHLAWARGELLRAGRAFAEVLRHRDLDPRTEAIAAGGATLVALTLGDAAAALKHARADVAAADRAGEPHGRVMARLLVARARAASEDPAAGRWFAEAAALAAEQEARAAAADRVEVISAWAPWALDHEPALFASLIDELPPDAPWTALLVAEAAGSEEPMADAAARVSAESGPVEGLAAWGRVVRRFERARWIEQAFRLAESIEATDAARGYMARLRALDRRAADRLAWQAVLAPEVVDDMLDDGVLDDRLSIAPAAVLFADMRSYTESTEHMDVEEVVGLVRQFVGELARAVGSRGTIDKYTGDGVMVLFRGSGGVDAAVSAALEMQERCRFVALRGQPVRVGIGIHFGPVAYATVGPLAFRQRTALGAAVNLAARLQALGDAVYLTEDAAARLSPSALPDLVLTPLGPQEIKGFARPVPVVRVSARLS